jgi:hypothetical protein
VKLLLLASIFLAGALPVRAQSTLDTIGVTALRAQDAALTGHGVIVSQIESAPDPLEFEVNPASASQPAALFAWRSAAGMATRFPNLVGTESSHADTVADALYGQQDGVAPGLFRVENCETNFFYRNVILASVPPRAAIFNQSFEFGPHNAAQDEAYDDYIALHNTTVVSGVGNGGAILSPADCYNGLGVAAYGGASSTGPTVDGRCKPDITAPAGATSFSTPLVAGAAAILVQAGRELRVNATAAIDSRTVKALLLTGAVKPSGWTQSVTVPLDPNDGAGIVNIFNSYDELAAGRLAPAASSFSETGHPPLTSGSAAPMPKGWDLRSITSSPKEQEIRHYLIATTSPGALISTLVWNRSNGHAGINRLTLYVYDSGGNLLGSSQSTVDNVQHIYIGNLSAGTYEIQVVKAAGAIGTPGVEFYRDVYALAWDFER